MRRALATAAKSPVEILSGLFFLLLGIALSTTQGWTRVVGGATAAVAGLLLSWTMAKELAKESASAALRPQLESVSRHLGTISAQMTEAVLLGQKGGEVNVCLPLIQQSAQSLVGIVTEVQAIMGVQFSPKAMLDTAASLEELRQDLAGVANHVRSSVPAEAMEAPFLESIEERLALLTDRLQGANQRLMLPETAQCPSCAGSVTFPLGSLQGDTATPTCSHCGERFNVHRQRAGMAIRAEGIAKPVELECPRCSNDVTIRTSSTTQRYTERYCFSCFARLVIDVHRAHVVSDEDSKPLQGRAEVEGAQTWLTCPQCDGRVRSIFYTPGNGNVTYYAPCLECHELLLGSIDVPDPVGDSLK